MQIMHMIYLRMPDIDGGLIGGASLKTKEFFGNYVFFFNKKKKFFFFFFFFMVSVSVRFIHVLLAIVV